MENTIINNDCMKVFEQIADSSVNLTLTDILY